MSPPCDSEIGVENELALRFSIVMKPVPLLEYIKVISSLVGASHILAVFEESDTVKVFFDDKIYVDALIKSGIHVMGHHVRVDYVVPPGTKVVISNIDPVVSNFDLSRLLSMYGMVISPIIRPPISDDMEFCHIAYGVRYCYMTINEPIPSKLEFKYGDQLCLVKIRVGEEMSILPLVKSDENDQNESDIECLPGPSNDDDNPTSTTPFVVSVESAASESNSVLNVAVELKRNYVKRKGRPHKTLNIKRTKVTATTRAAKKIKRNVKNKWIGVKKVKPFKKGRRGRKTVKLIKKSSSSPPALVSESNISSPDVDDSNPPLLISENGEYPEGPLNEEKLLGFIDESRHNRALIELAKKYLGSNYNEDMMHELIEQLEKRAKSSACQNLKLRLSRVCKLLKESL